MLSLPRHLTRFAAIVSAALTLFMGTGEGSAQTNDAATVAQIPDRAAGGVPPFPAKAQDAPIARVAGAPAPALSPARTQQIDLCAPDVPRSLEARKTAACSNVRAKSDGLTDAASRDPVGLGDNDTGRNVATRAPGSAPNADVIANRLRTGDVQTSAIADSVGVGLRAPVPAPTPDARPVVPR